MTRAEERELARKCQAEGIEFRTRYPLHFGYVATGPAEVMTPGREVVYERATDGALKRYKLSKMLWEGKGVDGALRRIFELEYQRRSEPHPMGRCKRCGLSKRTNKMRCSGNGLYCEPVEKAA